MQFISANLDFLCLIYILGAFQLPLILWLTGSLFNMRRPWIWAACSGLLAGLAGLTNLFALSSAGSGVLYTIEILLNSLAWLALFEFGRTGFKRQGKRGLGRWVYLPSLLLLGLGGGLGGLNGVDITSRLVLALPAAVFAGGSIVLETRSMPDRQQRSLRLAGGLIILTTTLTALVVPAVAGGRSTLVHTLNLSAEWGLLAQIGRAHV